MKIVYCIDSIYTSGGIQVVTIQKANALNGLGHEVWLVVTDHKENEATKRLSDKVHLVNLNINYYEDDWKSYYYVLKAIIVKRKLHKNRMYNILNQIKPDIVISTGTSEKYFLPLLKISSNPVFIREIHFYKYYRNAYAKTFLEKCSAVIGNFVDYSFRLKKYNHVIVLSKEDLETNWSKMKHISYIYNPITIQPDKISTLENKKFLSVGRLCTVKNHISLIRAWKYVYEKHPDWKLEIWGDGDQKVFLSQEIKLLKLQDVVFLKGHSYNIASVLENGSGFVLSSIAEGFALVLVEAMACGLPVISYKCPCGPKDLINDGVNGFLCEINNERQLANSINLLIEDKTKRKSMGEAALKRSQDFSLEKIAKQWENLFITLLKERKPS